MSIGKDISSIDLDAVNPYSSSCQRYLKDVGLEKVITMKGRITSATLALGMVLLVLLTACGNLSPVASFTYASTSGESPLTVSFNASYDMRSLDTLIASL